MQIAPTVPDAQSAPNALFGDGCHTHVFVADPPYEIPLTQNHPSKCLNRMVFGSLPRSLHLFLSFFPHFCNDVAGDIPENVDVPPVAAQVNFGDGFRGSNSVEIMYDSEPYEMARALDSEDTPHHLNITLRQLSNRAIIIRIKSPSHLIWLRIMHNFNTI